jgi:hypothetical protein
MSKNAQLFGVFVIWAIALVIFAIIAGLVQSDWPILIPLGGAFIHAFIVATRKR